MIGVYHGGDLASATREFGCPTDGWLDLSTGINPLPWSVPPRMFESLCCLPDSEQIEMLNTAAAEAYGIEEIGCIACGPGSQALIQWLPRLRDKCRVAVFAPTYGEHAHAWRAAGHNVFETSSMPNAGECEIAVLTRPNNPDGASIEIDAVAGLAADLEKKGGFVLVDEAFADLDPVASICAGGWAGIIALRSFGKFYGLPGLRLGFAIADSETTESLRSALGPWPVSSLAAMVGAAALVDKTWQTETRNRLAFSSGQLDSILEAAGLDIVGGTHLFRLVISSNARAIHEKLAQAGIFTRYFPENPRWLRFGLPGKKDDWERLEKAFGL